MSGPSAGERRQDGAGRRDADDMVRELRRFLFGENGGVGFYEWSRSVNAWMSGHDEQHAQQRQQHERTQQDIRHLVEAAAKELVKTVLAIAAALILLHLGTGR